MAYAWRTVVVTIGEKTYSEGDIVSFTTEDGIYWENVKILHIGIWIDGSAYIKVSGKNNEVSAIQVANIDD